MTLYFNPTTNAQLTALSADLPQGILLDGPLGAGLLTTAQFIAGDSVAAIIEPTSKDGDIDHAKGTITVKRIRELYEQSRSKSLTRQIFIIDDADKMSAGAQNAFLKLLEEPNSMVHFILTSHSANFILPTIKSRVEQVSIKPISPKQSQELLTQQKLDIAKQTQALFIANGKPAELCRMAADGAYFDQNTAIMSAAKQLIGGNRLQQFHIVFQYSSDREKTLKLLQSAIIIAKFSLNSHANNDLLRQADKLASAYDTITANGNVKLQLLSAIM